jgi:hypothetical protein
VLSQPPPVNRRKVLLGAAALTLLGATGSACASEPSPPKVDELEAQRDLAEKDSAMAAAAANAAGPDYAPALTVVAAERAAHAKALTDEIARAAGKPSPTSTTASSTAASSTAVSTTPTTPAPPPPSLNDVTAALRSSADSAAQLAAKLSGYRAGLLGSIAASCTTSVTVPLAAKQASS